MSVYRAVNLTGVLTLYPLSHVYSQEISGTVVDEQIKNVLFQQNPELQSLIKGDIKTMRFNAAVQMLKKQLSDISSASQSFEMVVIVI